MVKDILIISKDGIENSTEDVMDWLWYMGHNVVRINGEIFEQNNIKVTYIDNVLSFEIHNKIFKLQYDSIWLRRWSDNGWINILKALSGFDEYLYDAINNISSELGSVRDLFLSNLKSKNILTNPSQLKVNKLVVLKIAGEIGLNIPDYILTTTKEDVLKFANKYSKVIVKDINYQFSLQTESKSYLSYAELVDKAFEAVIPENFMLSLIQEYIEKSIEIRCFFLNNVIYSMAIFSQADEKTSIDFRKYNYIKPNRTVPYRLPEEIEDKIKQLMTTLNLTTGSIDIIKSVDNKYYFLEVNPVGQFGMVSYPCNYNLEKAIASYLSS